MQLWATSTRQPNPPETGHREAARRAKPCKEFPADCSRLFQGQSKAVSGGVGCLQVCNHKFHNECLQQWGDSSCPVCRYSVSKSHESSCGTCGTTSDLWMCLICGHVGCGRYNAAHAREHYATTAHNYALEVETSRVRAPALAVTLAVARVANMPLLSPDLRLSSLTLEFISCVLCSPRRQCARANKHL